MNLENGTTPARPLLSEVSAANMEQFVEYVLTILPAVRVDGFLIKTRTPTPRPFSYEPHKEHHSETFVLKLANGEVNAAARLESGEFVVQVGSVGRATWIGVYHSYQRLFDELVESNVYVASGGQRRFDKAYAFSSPSAAGAVLNGRATAGPVAWVLASDSSKTYKQWEADQLGHRDSTRP